MAIFTFSFSSCSHLVYQPSRQKLVEPARYGFSYNEIEFQTKDKVKLHGWFFPAKDTRRPKGTFIQFHGNAENITTHFGSLVWVIEHGYNFFTFDYRGYGKSEGDPSQEGLNEDALAAIHLVRSKWPGPLFLYGQSLGGAVLMRATEDIQDRSDIRVVIVEGSFHSYQAIAAAMLAKSWLTWIFQPLGYLLVSDSYSPKPSIPKISPTPLLVIHGDKDQVIPFEFGQKVFELAKEPKWFWQVENGRHIDTMIRNDKYQKKLIEFLERPKS